MKKLYTEYDIIQIIKKGDRIIHVLPGAIFTPSARDKITEAKLRVIDQLPEMINKIEAMKLEKKPIAKTIVIGSDHTGFAIKASLKEFLRGLNLKIIDVGPNNADSCDYPDYALKVAQAVISGEANLGLMLDATGIPSAITVNKIPGIRGATCYNEFTARSAREHNDANIIVLGAKALGEESIKSILEVFLFTKFTGGRHQKRLDKIKKVEEKLLKPSK